MILKNSLRSNISVFTSLEAGAESVIFFFFL